MNYRWMGAGVTVFLCSATFGGWLSRSRPSRRPPHRDSHTQTPSLPSASASSYSASPSSASSSSSSSSAAAAGTVVPAAAALALALASDGAPASPKEEWVDRPEGEIDTWSGADVKQWLRSIGLAQYASAVDRRTVTGKQLAAVQHTQDFEKLLGVTSKNHQKRLFTNLQVYDSTT